MSGKETKEGGSATDSKDNGWRDFCVQEMDAWARVRDDLVIARCTSFTHIDEEKAALRYGKERFAGGVGEATEKEEEREEK